VAGDGTEGFSGDNGPATGARLSHPPASPWIPPGNLYIADFSNNRIRKISNGVITTVAGNGTLPPGSSGDGGPATSGPIGLSHERRRGLRRQPLYRPTLANNCIRRVSRGMIATVAGNGIPGFSGDNGPAAGAQLYLPEGVAVDPAGNLYIADLHKPSASATVSNGVIPRCGDGIVHSATTDRHQRQ